MVRRASLRTSGSIRRARGFTLIELLIVVALIGTTAAIAAMSMKGQRGEKAPAFARALLGMCHEARQTAIATGFRTRIRLVKAVTNTGRAVLETADATGTFATSTNTSEGLRTPLDVDFADVGTIGQVTAPALALSAAERYVCFYPDGTVDVPVNSATTCNATSAASGANVFVRSFDDRLRFRIMIFGHTGLPRLVDTW